MLDERTETLKTRPIIKVQLAADVLKELERIRQDRVAESRYGSSIEALGEEAIIEFVMKHGRTPPSLR